MSNPTDASETALENTVTRRTLLAGTAALGLAGGVAQAASTPAPRSPNIIYIIADDLGVYDLGCYGQTKIRTPNIDRMASQGMQFTQAYGGAPICSPSRCALMTGRHMGHASIRDNFALAGGVVGYKGQEKIRRANLPDQEPTVATVLKDQGYVTGLVGKWHLDGYAPAAVPTRHGFDEFHGWLTQTEKTQGYFPEKWYDGTTLLDVPGNAGEGRAVYETDIVTDQSCDFIRRHRQKPFFLTVAYNAPHSPYVTPAEGDYGGEPWGRSEKTYAAMIEFLDAGVGSILRALEELGLDEDTVVFFSSDHGPRSEPTAEQTDVVTFFNSHGPLRGYKRELYEGGIRVPLIARWPGHIAAGAKEETPVYHPDFLPTAVGLAGKSISVVTDGHDLTPVLLGDRRLPERLLYWETYEPAFWQAARQGKWKIVRPVGSSRLELYDLAADPSEKRDVAAKYPDIVSKLSAQLVTEHRPSREYPIAL
ncbi:arylsulfatase [Gluconobacter sp.]|uniref:arylsulfatase n=1 Tax=Gluconobacter sp. TaxID=1876758 RepID=UPI0039EAF3EE